MKKIYLLAKTLNKLGFRKEAKELLSLKKNASNPAAWNKIRSKLFMMQNVFDEIGEILYEFVQYRKADRENEFLSKEDEREISRKIFSKVGTGLGLSEESYELSDSIGWLRENLRKEVRIFLREIESNLNRFYNLLADRVYKNELETIKLVNLLYWYEKIKLLSKKCKNFANSREADFIETEDITSGGFNFDPSRENTVVGLEPTMTGVPEFQTSTEITIPTNF